jgi:hypothetical protein
VARRPLTPAEGESPKRDNASRPQKQKTTTSTAGRSPGRNTARSAREKREEEKREEEKREEEKREEEKREKRSARRATTSTAKDEEKKHRDRPPGSGRGVVV